VRGLGTPQSSRDAFVKLVEAGLVEPELGDDLQRMVGFRTIAIHRYQDLDIGVLRAIVREKLHGFAAFVAAMLRASG
jgi:uncharacterized protein YutE (UPF0331/DUF86 family)